MSIFIEWEYIYYKVVYFIIIEIIKNSRYRRNADREAVQKFPNLQRSRYVPSSKNFPKIILKIIIKLIIFKV